jgi:hypothetical protein
MSEMIERVAKAIVGPCLGDPEKMARAAIEAMREPTVAMERHAMEDVNTYDIWLPGDFWRVMIDSALDKAVRSPLPTLETETSDATQ